MPNDFEAEESVFEAAVGGDRFAFEELARRHGGWVRGVIYGVLADRDRLDDVAQQVWTTVWEQSASLRDTKRWRPWLYRMAHNAAIDAGREQSRRRRAVQRAGQSRTSEVVADWPRDGLAEAEQKSAVRDAIESLPLIYREPFVMRHVQGWCYRQIADAMGLPVDTVETRLVRARRILREKLKNKVG